MKRELFLILGLGCGISLGFWIAVDFQRTQETHFIRSDQEKNSLKNQVNALKNDVNFVKKHQEELDFLIEKGWFIPKNRLIAGEILEKLRVSLNEIQYTFEPEIIQNLEEEYPFKVTKIIIEVGALLESDIYEFLDTILEKFSGILRLHEFTLSHGEEVNKKNLSALRKNVCPNFVKGKLIFEWFALGRQDHEN